MITEWNYRTPLTCDEACELEEFRMLNDLKEKSERRDFYSKIGGTELSEEKIEKATFGKEFEIFYLENYRLKLHERVPALTTDEIENISIYALDLVRSKKEGYTIVDIKADQTDPDRKRSIFFFKNEDGILDMVKKICKEK